MTEPVFTQGQEVCEIFACTLESLIVLQSWIKNTQIPDGFVFLQTMKLKCNELVDLKSAVEKISSRADDKMCL